MKKLVGSRGAWIVGAVVAALTIGCGGPETLRPQFLVHDGDIVIVRTLDPTDPSSGDVGTAAIEDGSLDDADDAPLDGGTTGDGTVEEEAEPALAATLLWIDADTFPVEVGGSAELKAFARFEDGTYGEVTDSVTWSSTAPSIATVSGGRVEGLVEGAATLLVTLGDLEDFVGVMVGGQAASEISLVSIHVELPGPLVTLVEGELLELSLHGVYSDGSEFDLTEHATWSTSDLTVCGVEKGTLSANAPGYALVTASFQGHTVELDVDVQQAE